MPRLVGGDLVREVVAVGRMMHNGRATAAVVPLRSRGKTRVVMRSWCVVIHAGRVGMALGMLRRGRPRASGPCIRLEDDALRGSFTQTSRCPSAGGGIKRGLLTCRCSIVSRRGRVSCADVALSLPPKVFPRASQQAGAFGSHILQDILRGRLLAVDGADLKGGKIFVELLLQREGCRGFIVGNYAQLRGHPTPG